MPLKKTVSGKKLKIGITCYPSVGGSGIVATELGNELARRGHEIHFISYDVPFRANVKLSNVFFHQVEINAYRLFKYPDYTLPLAVKMNEVHHRHKLDILHVHYAIPHAAAALLAEQMCDYRCGSHPKIITTLHGTDISLLGRDLNLRPIIKYSIEKSDAVTAVSAALKNETMKLFRLRKRIEVIHNFYRPEPVKKSRIAVRKSLGIRETDHLLIHLSNLRPVKRIPDLLQVFGRIAEKDSNARLLLLAGASFEPYQVAARRLRLGKRLVIRPSVKDIGSYINASDLGLYTSDTESFGMGILETMSYGVPVVATKVGGVPEVIDAGKSGFLRPVGDVAGLARDALKLLQNQKLRLEMGEHARKRAGIAFNPQRITDRYLQCYYQLLKK